MRNILWPESPNLFCKEQMVSTISFADHRSQEGSIGPTTQHDSSYTQYLRGWACSRSNRTVLQRQKAGPGPGTVISDFIVQNDLQNIL